MITLLKFFSIDSFFSALLLPVLDTNRESVRLRRPAVSFLVNAVMRSLRLVCTSVSYTLVVASVFYCLSVSDSCSSAYLTLE